MFPGAEVTPARLAFAFNDNTAMTADTTRTADYCFTRDNTTPHGVMSSQRASTDAMTVVRRWEASGPGRSANVIQDEDELLVVRMAFDVSDWEAAAAKLDSLCFEMRVKRKAVE